MTSNRCLASQARHSHGLSVLLLPSPSRINTIFVPQNVALTQVNNPLEEPSFLTVSNVEAKAANIAW